MKPWILLDVDGVLNIIEPKPEQVLDRGLVKRYFTVRPAPSTAEVSSLFDGWVDEGAYKSYRASLKQWKRRQWTSTEPMPQPVLPFIFDPTLAKPLQDLQEVARLGWATTWLGEADAHVGPLFGLPSLPHVPFLRKDREGVRGLQFWKTPRVLQWAQGETFLWFDDDLSKYDKREVALASPESRTVPLYQGRGLTLEDITAAREWAVKTMEDSRQH